MNVTINGENQTIAPGASILDIVENLCGTPVPTGVAVALNSMVIPRKNWADTTLEEDDALEILWASSGG